MIRAGCQLKIRKPRIAPPSAAGSNEIVNCGSSRGQ
jgi:hypothetical protein